MGYKGSGTSHLQGGGFTLVELLIVLVIVCLLLGLGVPGMRRVVASSQAAATIMDLHALLNTARSEAVTRATEITLCGTEDGVSCLRDWQSGAMVFVDRDRDRKLDTNEELLELGATAKHGSLRWRGSGGRRYLRFRADGTVREVGSYVWCPDDADARYARGVIVSFTGRARAARDRDGDGYQEDAGGNALSCDA